MKLILRILFLLYSGITCAQQAKTGSLLNFIPEHSTADEKIHIYLKLFDETSDKNMDSAGIYLERARSCLTELVADTLKQQLFQKYAGYFLSKHQYDSTHLYVKKALSLEKLVPKKDLIETYSTLGTTNYYQSNFEEAIANHLKALKLCEETACNAQHLAGIYNNISVVYIAIADWNKAEIYLNKALSSIKGPETGKERTRAKSNLAIVYAMQGEFDKAAAIFKEEIQFNIKEGNRIRESKNYNNLGVLYERQGNPGAALENYQIALQIAREINDKASVALGYQNVAIVQRKLGQYNKAAANFETGLAMTRALGNRDKLRDGLYGIAELYEEKGDYKKAVDYYKQFFELNDSIANEKLLNSVNELEIKYETEKKEKDILALSEQKLKNEAAINKQRSLIRKMIYGFAGALLIVLMSFIIYRQYLSNKKKQDMIDVINSTQTEERTRIARDLHDSVGGSLALIKNKLQAVLTKPPAKQEEVTEILETLTATGDQVRQIAHNLMPGELVRFGLIPAIRTLIEQVNKENLHAQFYATEPEKRLEPTLEIQLYRIVQEAVQNVLKHAGAKNLYIHLNRHKQYLNLMIEDDGVGIVPDAQAGMGIQNIRQRIEILKGTFNMDISAQTGTTLTIQIPL